MTQDSENQQENSTSNFLENSYRLDYNFILDIFILKLSSKIVCSNRYRFFTYTVIRIIVCLQSPYFYLHRFYLY